MTCTVYAQPRYAPLPGHAKSPKSVVKEPVAITFRGRTDSGTPSRPTHKWFMGERRTA